MTESWTFPKRREEGSIIPEGVSLTETEVAWHIRIRKNDLITHIRVAKESLGAVSVSYEIRNQE